MRSSTIVKIILIIFFIIFFSILGWYFYDPGVNTTNENLYNENDGIFSLLPFGSSDRINKSTEDNKIPKSDESNNSNDGSENTEKENVLGIKKYEMPVIRQISNIPTAGAFIEKLSKDQVFEINKNMKNNEKIDGDGDYFEIRYIAMKNNHVYQSYDFTLDTERISNVTIPKIFNAEFFDINNYIIRYINNFNLVKTYSITLSDKPLSYDEDELDLKKEKKFQGIFLPDGIEDLSVLSKDKKIAYIEKGDYKNKLIIMNSRGDGKTEVASTKLNEVNLVYNNTNKIFLSSKTADSTNTLSFVADIKNKKLEMVNYPIKAGYGLPNYNFSKVLYSGINKYSDKFRLFVVSEDDRSTRILNSRTFADKCVWLNDNIHVYCAIPAYLEKKGPNNWYKGKKYFSDEIYKINTDNGEEEKVFIPKDRAHLFDMVDLKLTEDERYLYFKDKKTDFYWSIDIKNIKN